MTRSAAHTRQLFTVGVVTLLSAGILISGTFGWRSISQEAVNEFVRKVDAGGRLHDDFDGTNKDVYAENYTSANEGGLPILVRIRLDEYMETGPDAGKNLTATNRDVTAVLPGTKADNKSTWVTHIPGASDPEKCTGVGAQLHDAYWTWSMGGSKTYVPTFNKNKDSLSADINGTYEGTQAGDDVHYDDYVEYDSYTLGQNISGTAIYDADTNDVDEGASSVLGTNHIEKTEIHQATKTQNALVWTMAQWKSMGCPSGPYWVYDTDGWAYWAEMLQPGEATGLLLDKVELTGTISKNVYYAINVVAQFATADDWGSKDDPVGFYEGYDEENGITGPSEDALFLLNQASGKEYELEVKTSDGTVGQTSGSVANGEALSFTCKVKCMKREVADQKVKWSVKGAGSKDTVIDQNGVLTVGTDETSESLQVTATYSEKIRQTVLVEVIQK